MAENSASHFRQELDFGGTKQDDNVSCSSSTLAENMREQPKATKLVYSPRRPAKNVGKSNENGKSKSLLKETKVFKSVNPRRPNKLYILSLKAIVLMFTNTE